MRKRTFLDTFFSPFFQPMEVEEVEDMCASPFDNMWKWNSPFDVELTCPSCLKKIGLEGRFISPILPKAITCPYCGVVTEWESSEDKNKGKAELQEES